MTAQAQTCPFADDLPLETDEERDSRSLSNYADAWESYCNWRNAAFGAQVRVIARVLRDYPLSLRALAAELGVTPSYLSKVARGKEQLSPFVAAQLSRF